MIEFPNAKVNLGLRVLGKRGDGLHDIETCFYPIPFSDVLEVVESRKFEFEVTGIQLDCSRHQNTCYKMYQLLRERIKTPVRIHLHKIIPPGSGLGGGSSDAASLLKLLNKTTELNLNAQACADLCARIGADVPFFYRNLPCLGEGTGTRLTPLEVDLSGYFLLLVLCEINISTAEEYDALGKPPASCAAIRDILSDDIKTWGKALSNDFEHSVCRRHPRVGKALKWLRKSDALFSGLSGTGSATFGIFATKPQNLPPGFQSKILEL